MASAVPVYLHLLRAKDLIDREYARQLDVPTLAREAHASTAHFSRSFRQAFGETPHRYLLRRQNRAIVPTCGRHATQSRHGEEEKRPRYVRVTRRTPAPA